MHAIAGLSLYSFIDTLEIVSLISFVFETKSYGCYHNDIMNMRW